MLLVHEQREGFEETLSHVGQEGGQVSLDDVTTCLCRPVPFVAVVFLSASLNNFNKKLLINAKRKEKKFGKIKQNNIKISTLI